VDVAIPKLRSGSYFPGWLLTRRKWAERALTSMAAALLSARRVDAAEGAARRIPCCAESFRAAACRVRR